MRIVCSCFVLLIAAGVSFAQTKTAIESISILPNSFNPSLNQSVGVTISLAKEGLLTAKIVNRKGEFIKSLVEETPVKPGKLSLKWDGHDNSGQIVDSDAYLIRVELQEDRQVETFDSGKKIGWYPIRAEYYDPERAILSYSLPESCLVSIEAGVYNVDSSTKVSEKVVGKTILNWEPRISGPVIQIWNGYDSKGNYIVNNPNFYLSIRCNPLPENSIIVTGHPARASK